VQLFRADRGGDSVYQACAKKYFAEGLTGVKSVDGIDHPWPNSGR